jgi:hypothetical protein
MTNAKLKTSDAQRTCILVLGMHRSGTSALAGLLTKLGCEGPANPMPASKANAKGFFESLVISQFNDELLQTAGSSWDDITHFPERWRDSPTARALLDRAGELLHSEFGDAPLFVLKDPRICRLVPFWTSAIERSGCAVRPIVTIRNPLEVARSMGKKKGFGEPLSEMVWLRYVLDSEHASRSMRRFITSFEQLLHGWEAVAQSAQEELGIVWPKSIANAESDAANFLADDLQHHKQSQARAVTSELLPEWLRETYDILRRWTQGGESADDYPALDRIRAEFDVASTAFLRVVRTERQKVDEARRKLRSVQEENAQLQSHGAELKRQLDVAGAAQDEREALRQTVAALQEDLEGVTRRAEDSDAARERERRVLEQTLEEHRANAEAATAAEAERFAAELALLEAETQASVEQLKLEIQQQRRLCTFLRAEVQQAEERVEAAAAEVAESRSEAAASRSRRKEMARVIADREAKLQATKDELQTRYAELATLQRELVRSSPSWIVRSGFRKMRRMFAG